MKLTMEQTNKILRKLKDYGFETIDTEKEHGEQLNIFNILTISEEYFNEKVNEALENTEIDISKNLTFLIADIIGIERYKINLNRNAVICDSVTDIEKVTKFIKLLTKNCNVSAPNRNANSVMNCIEEIYGQKIITVLGLSNEEIQKMIDYFREKGFNPYDKEAFIKELDRCE